MLETDLQVDLVETFQTTVNPKEIWADKCPENKVKEDLVVKDKWVVLVDDVTNTGVTLAHALTPFLQQPTRGISMAVLVDREHHRYPVRADIQGLSLATTLQEHIDVQWDGKAWSVYLS